MTAVRFIDVHEVCKCGHKRLSHHAANGWCHVGLGVALCHCRKFRPRRSLPDGETPPCECARQDADRYPAATDRVIVPTVSGCPVHDPGCERHRGEPHNLCPECWKAEASPSGKERGE